jgi:hypothetical protein
LCVLAGTAGSAQGSPGSFVRSASLRAALAQAGADEAQSGLVLVAGEVLDVKIVEGGTDRKADIEQCIRGSIWEFDGKDKFFYSSCDTLPNTRPVKGGYQDDGGKLVFLAEPGGDKRMKVVGVLTVLNKQPVIIQHVEITPEGSTAGAKPLVFEFVVSLRAGSSDSRVARTVTA